ncbi:aldehyde dehydrogenase family protein [Pelagibacteraceae bacterium]|nr:aldehyde dehydrogenase family protein [Pelagibacteraceae bacterium]
MENLQKFYINGKWVEPRSKNTMPVINPATEEQIGTVAMGNAEDVDLAVSAANEAFVTFSQTSIQDRLDLLIKIKDVTQKRFEELVKAMSTEMGAPMTMARDAQADAAIGHLDGFIDALKNLEDQKTLPNGDVLCKEAIGVCGLITPWNWPINQITLKVLPAIATGCASILKPSEHTPISAVVYTEILHDAGVPAGVLNLVQGNGEDVGVALSRHPDIQMISFTGSTRGGISVTKESATTVKKVTLELGGKSPNLVFADCDLQEKVTASVNECMFNTGQSCDAPTRLLVEKKCYAEVLEIAKKAAENISLGDPTKEGDHLGPLFDKIQYDRVQTMIKVGIDEGVTLLTGGLGKPEGFETGWYTKPTIFADVTNDKRVAQEEIFGPVLVIIPFEDEADAIKIANDTPYGLAAYMQTGSKERADRVARQLRAGAVHVNGAGYNYGSPFGGYKQSGNGREGGDMGIEDYLETKTLHFPS